MGTSRLTHRPAWLRVGGTPGLLALVVLLTAFGASCTTEGNEASGTEAGVPERIPTHIDSIFPIEEELRRFRSGLEERSRLEGGEDSLEGLVDAYLRALEGGDRDRLREMALNRAEFAWLYYPHTMYMAPPYELEPALVWFQLENVSSRGLTRALRVYEGKTLYDTGFECPDGAEPFGAGRIHHGCQVLGELPTGESVRETLFGSILEVDGWFKIVSYANEL